MPRGLLFRVASLALLAASAGVPLRAGRDPRDRPSSFRVHLDDPREARALRHALEAARRRLGRPFCQEILSDYTDAAGRTLETTLGDLGYTPAGYLGLVLFVDGAATAACRSGGVTAATSPGSRVVWVCGRRLADQWQEDGRHVELVMIHELLHTLGLGENPPSSAAITVRVRWRCGGPVGR